MYELGKLIDELGAQFVEGVRQGMLNEIREELKIKQYPLVLDIKEASEYSGIPVGRLRQYARTKGFPVLERDSANASLFFSRDGLDEWVRGHSGND